MTELDEMRRKQYLKKLVSNSRAILTKQISFPLGSLKMEKIILWINYIEPITELDLKVFAAYNSQTSDYPIGEDRLHYDSEFLAKLDVDLNKLNSDFRENIELKCLDIIEIFNEKK